MYSSYCHTFDGSGAGDDTVIEVILSFNQKKSFPNQEKG